MIAFKFQTCKQKFENEYILWQVPMVSFKVHMEEGTVSASHSLTLAAPICSFLNRSSGVIRTSFALSIWGNKMAFSFHH